MVTGNLFAKVPQQLADEAVEELLSAPNVRIERIVSMGHATAPDECYDAIRTSVAIGRAGTIGSARRALRGVAVRHTSSDLRQTPWDL